MVLVALIVAALFAIGRNTRNFLRTEGLPTFETLKNRRNGVSVPLNIKAKGEEQMSTQTTTSQTTTKKAFTCNLVTIRSKKSFGEVTNAIETMFQDFDLDKLRKLTEAKDAKAVAQYVDQVSKPHPFSLFFKFDQGPIFRLAGIPIESRFYLFGNATIAQGLFKYSPVSGLGAPVRFCVSQRDGDEETRIDIDEPSSFFSQFPELKASSVPAELDEKMIRLLQQAAE
jgi:uncharacterized protein (DUF302 family)